MEVTCCMNIISSQQISVDQSSTTVKQKPTYVASGQRRIYSWLFGNIRMFFKCKMFEKIAELLFTAIFSKENIGKNGQKK